jgi:O-acetylserine/cysteine efflux transporter
MSTSLSIRHFLLALAVVAVWGSNFVIVKVALGHMPPLLFAALRFAAAALPMVFFMRRPRVRWRNLAAYGLLIGVGQFGVMFIAMNGHISPGVVSLVIQTQVFFTIGLAMMLAGESLKQVQWLALSLAAAGLLLIALHTDGSTSLLGLALTLAAALSWAVGNLVSRRAGQVNMVAYVVWSSAFAVPPLLGLALWFEGWSAVRDALLGADALTWLAVGWQAWGNSLFGYAAWAWLLSRYSAATITPMALLVPVFGMGTASWYLGESLPAWKLGAAALVMSGLALNILWPWWLQKRQAQRAAS